MDDEIRKRLRWIQLYEETGNAGMVCLRCGISSPTLRKWWHRYQESGLDDQQEESRRSKTSPNRKVEAVHEQLIAAPRKRRRGYRRIQNEQTRFHELSFSTATIYKMLERLEKPHLDRTRHFRYVVRDGLYALQGLSLHKYGAESNTLDLLDAVIEEMPFSLQLIRTD